MSRNSKIGIIYIKKKKKERKREVKTKLRKSNPITDLDSP